MYLPLAPADRAKVGEFQRKHHTRLLALLFTDVVGSTELTRDLGDVPSAELVEVHHETVRRVLRSFSEGDEISVSGDSFFIVFSKPSDAVRFALSLQGALRTGQGRADGKRILDRIGIHVGEVVITEQADGAPDFYGIQVNLCSRVMELAQGDQILLTRTAFDSARQILKGEDIPDIGPLSWLNHGTFRLKGVEDPEEICEVGEEGKAVLKVPPDSEKVHRYAHPDLEPVMGWRPAVGVVVPGTRWVLEKKLGEGGFGEVWLGRHETLKERRVFKFCFRADRVRSLKREMTLFRLLKERIGNHPNIVAVLDVYFDEPPFYLVMDYGEDADLQRWCEEKGGAQKVPLATRLEIVAQVADALEAAHRAGVIHRDIKPSNILIHAPPRDSSAALQPSLTVKLTDFGIGEVVSREVLAGLTKQGFTETRSVPTPLATGTQLYMPPELLSGKPASTRSDIYSLGVVLYQLLLGDFSRPLTIDWQNEITDSVLAADLAKCLSGNPAGRFASALELASHLRAWQQRRAEQAEQEAAAAARKRAARRRRLVLGAAIAVCLVAAAVALGIYTYNTIQSEARDRKLASEATLRAETARHQANDAEHKQLELSQQLTNALRELSQLLQSTSAGVSNAGETTAALRTREYELKAGVLYHLIEYVQWPPVEALAQTNTATIGLLGANPFEDVLHVLDGKTVKGKMLMVKRVSEPADYQGCHVIFISGSGRDYLPQILDGLKGKPILTVADTPGLAARGVMVNLVASPANRISMEINPEAVQRSHLTLSPQLLKLAKVVP
ncbi:MAG TPA: YfiR/HmsC family protein [Candidatus Binatia bacterium]|jgi:serine/threonine protein kinase/class 3 adenylate cyclase|nr:YfiR/HmsC family protein [Candidatus Binatia bacterium]